MIEPQDIISEAAQSGENARVAADARGILTERDVARVVLFVFDAPVIAYGVGSLASTDRAIGQIEGGFARSVPKAFGGLESQYASFDRNDGPDMRLPFGPGNRLPGAEHRNGAGFVTVALFAVDCLHAGTRLGVVTDRLDLAAQGRLVVF